MKINDVFYDKILSEMSLVKNELYVPTKFWKTGLEKIGNNLRNGNIKNFRNLKQTRNFFVPTYLIEGLGFFPEEIINKLEEEIILKCKSKKAIPLFNSLKSGHHLAYADYRTFVAGDIIEKKPFLHNCSESTIGNPINQFVFNGKTYSRSMLNYLNGLVCLKQTINTDKIKNILEIGGGYGTLGEILLNDKSTKYKYINIDIPPTSYASSYYLNELYQSQFKSCFEVEKNNKIEIDKIDFQAMVLNSWQLPLLEGSIDLFVNYISFQEMNPEVVENYIKHIQRLNCKYILTRNIKEGKASKIDNTNEAYVEKPMTSTFFIDTFKKYGYKHLKSNIVPYGFKTCDGFNSEIIIFEKI